MANLSSDTLLGPRLNFEFAFNNADFSDRDLHIEIMPDSLSSKTDSEGCDSILKIEKLEPENEHSIAAEVKTLHISSAILAANSPFFYKLFKNGVEESKHKGVTMRINKSEDAAFTELLKFMYNNYLSVTTTPDFLSVLIIADKFEVTSCIRYCTSLLKRRPMSLESALLYLELPPTVLAAELVQPLINSAKKWLITHFKDINKSEEEAMTLPLFAIELILGSESLQADSRDGIFEFILKWAREHYPKLDVRREICTNHLTKFIPFLYMSCSKLKQVLVCPDFDHEEVSKLVNEALFFRIELPYGQLIHASNKCQLIKVEQLELPRPRCVVYFDMKKEECENLFPSSKIKSPSFSLSGRWFYLTVECYTKEQRKSFALFFNMTKESQNCAVDYEFAVINKSSKEFQIKRKGKFDNSDLRQGMGFWDLLGITWIDFISNDNDYFINGILHLRVDLIINN